MGLKKFRYFFDGDMIGCLQGSFRGVEQLTDLTVFPFLEITKLEDDPLHFGQRSYCLL